MYKLIRYFNQNRKKILNIIVVIAFGLILLQFINRQAANNNGNINKNAITQNNTTVNNNINTNSAIGGGTSNVTSKNDTDLIEQFIQYCNDAKINEAYNILSNECKENMYPTLQYFIQNYYNGNFATNKIYNIQSWIGSIYKVDLKENMLHTGNASVSSKQDYITVVYEEGQYKLNINNYIGRTSLNKQANIENLELKVIHKDSYMDYEIYTFEIKNNNDTHVYLDDLTKTDTVYITDKNNIKHVAYSHELAEEDLHIYPHSEKQIQIKFSNKHITGREYLKIVFENVVLDKATNKLTEISVNL